MSWIVGCDTGGTFTDVFAVSETGESRVAKVPSTPPRFDLGVVEGVRALGIDPSEVTTLFHGTTVTTNAVITRAGAHSALVTTRGFRDVLEIRRANRAELYDILWDPPEPLIRRRHRLEVDERVDYSGAVVTPLDEDSVRAVARKLRAREIESVAICLINAHMNPAHERRAREILLEELPGLHVSLSTDILPEPPEFERTATTVANAYCAPVLRSYMDTLEEGLGEAGFKADVVLVMHNGGGTMTTDYAKGVAVKTLNSGPAAGVIAAAAVAASAGRSNVVGFDMGGTSADIAVVRDGEPQLTRSFDLEWGMPIRFPSIDVVSIGAGGGSIAWLDPAGYPRSGPQSAGADPGPACYGKGGTEPTNTDAQLVLGRVSNDLFLEGRMELDVERSARRAAAHDRRAARPQPRGRRRGRAQDRERQHGQGDPPRDRGERLRPARVRPRRLRRRGRAARRRPGARAADARGDRAAVPRRDERDGAAVRRPARRLLLGLRPARARDRHRPTPGASTRRWPSAWSATSCARASTAPRSRVENAVDIRYIGQLHSVTVPLPEVSASGFTAAVASFHDEHLRQYRYSHPESPVETSTLRVTARGAREKPDLSSIRHAGTDRAALAARERQGALRRARLGRDAGRSTAPA